MNWFSECIAQMITERYAQQKNKQESTVLEKLNDCNIIICKTVTSCSLCFLHKFHKLFLAWHNINIKHAASKIYETNLNNKAPSFMDGGENTHSYSLSRTYIMQLLCAGSFRLLLLLLLTLTLILTMQLTLCEGSWPAQFNRCELAGYFALHWVCPCSLESSLDFLVLGSIKRGETCVIYERYICTLFQQCVADDVMTLLCLRETAKTPCWIFVLIRNQDRLSMNSESKPKTIHAMMWIHVKFEFHLMSQSIST